MDSKHLYENWCVITSRAVARGCILHLLSEKVGGRRNVHSEIVKTVRSHYQDPALLAARIKTLGFTKAAKILSEKLPKTKKARSGHLGEILAAEVVPAILPAFEIPIKRLRWLDGRETAMRGEDVIGLARSKQGVRFLKGESKSRINLTPVVVAQARKALKANLELPSNHAMAFIADQLFTQGNYELGRVFESFLVDRTIAPQDVVHLIFALSGNNAAKPLTDDLQANSGKIEQHAVNLWLTDHQQFIRSVYA
jgi:hypothetical protein